jgi:ribosomal protein L11 methyltransferase
MHVLALWRVSVATSAEAEEAVRELFAELFVQPASAYTDAETGRTAVAIYCETPPLSNEVAELRAGLRRIRGCGLNTGQSRITVRKLRRQDWAESWKHHFKPVQIGAKLLIKPGWNKRQPRPGQALVVLDPGLSFGTGRHPTTSFCLQQLVARRNRRRAQAFLDIGTGSGILAIAAAKLGYDPVHAFDLDPASVRVARANAVQNRVENRVRITRRDLARLPSSSRIRYDLICANLTGELLVQELPIILARLKQGAGLVLAGILKAQFGVVRRACSSAGLKMTRCQVKNEWQSALFTHRRYS